MDKKMNLAIFVLLLFVISTHGVRQVANIFIPCCNGNNIDCCPIIVKPLFTQSIPHHP